MRKAISLIAAGTLTGLPVLAAAQETEAPVATAEIAPVSDAELENFIRAASFLNQLRSSGEVSQEQMPSAVQQVLAQAELTPRRFNEIGKALDDRPELRTRAQQTIDRLRAQAAG